MRPLRTFGSALFSFLFLAAAVAGAQQQPSDLANMSIEDLMAIQVTSVDRRTEPLTDTTAAIYVITQDDIRHSGALSVPDVLRLAPGVQVAQISSNSWAVSIRGFNSRYSNKLLVLINGRTIYNPTTGGVYWQVHDLVLEDIERIEVIRGPGATMWGTNAVNGVINIITKPARDTVGSLVGAGGGNYESGFGYARYGAPLGESGDYRLSLQYGHHQGLGRSGGTDAGDRWGLLRGGFRADWSSSLRNAFVVQGELYREDATELNRIISPVAPYDTVLRGSASVTTGNALARWSHDFAHGAQAVSQIFYDHWTEETVGYLRQQVSTIDFDFQHRFQAGARHEFVWGGGIRFVRLDTVGSAFIHLSPPGRNLTTYGAFLQDEVTLIRKRLSLSFGAKIESNAFTGTEVQPSVRLLWRPASRQTLWSAVSRAIRSPNLFENAVQFNMAAFPIGPAEVELLQLVGNPKMRSEELLAYEVGYRVRPHDRVGLDVAGFFNRYHRLSACEVGTPALSGGILTIPYLLGNNLDGRSYGIEVAATYNVVRRWTLRGTYSWLHARTLANSSHPTAQSLLDLEAGPQHWFNVRSSLSLPHEVNLATSVFYSGAQVSGALNHYTRLDTQVAWAPARGWELSITGQNLLRPSHQEFIAWDQGVPELARRSIFARIVHRF